MGIDRAPRNRGAAELRARLRAAVADALRAADAPGAAVTLVADGREAFTAGVGCRDLAPRRPLTAQARFFAYSITKMLLAVAVLRLGEQGRLSLDEPIQAILPEIPLAAPVTVRQLLNHAAGLPDYGALPAYGDAVRANPGLPWTADEFFQRTLRQGLRFPPGHGWAYSNVGFLLVRQAIERIAQRPLRDALADLVFRPAGLRRTVMADSLADARMLTPGYSAQLDRDGALHDIARRYHPGWVAHGTAVTTAPDLARFIEALIGGRLLAPASLAAMREATAVPSAHRLFVQPAYGLGLMVDLGGRFGRMVGHAGGGPGYSTAAFHFPDVAGRPLTSVALVNRDAPDLGVEIAFALLTAFADRLGRSSD